ncbi:MAG: UDP-N-acetylmuramoyl-L-alanine--D-glutamate ligase [Clostridia bacterium]|nr:UDP-N-acetylmuramoyl-L-alanine--D-glutamate ligase [Clostridia bacterium]
MAYKNERLEEFNNYLKSRKVAIIGLGVSNIPLLDYMNEKEARVTVFDDRTIDKIPIEALEKIRKYETNSYFGEDSLKNLKGFDIIFRSPSCMPSREELQEEVKRGAILTSEIEMVLQMSPSTIIGVTGSDGKTTTTTLIYEIIKAKGYKCFLGGNIGTPLFTRIGEMLPEDIVVLEMSSFQLMGMEISPQISVITNISPNHLNIHKDYEEYIEAKKNILKNQDNNGVIVLNYDNEITREFENEANGKVRFFSSKEKLSDGIILDDGIIKECKDKVRRHILDTKNIKLRGNHNYENACAAIAATSGLVDVDTQIDVISNFVGVEHRLELVKEIDGVKWYNDSIGTSPTRTMAGLHSFDEYIILIAGGYDKHLDYKPLAKPILERVKTLILMGQTADKIFYAVKEEAEIQNKQIEIYVCDSLEDTVKMAHKVAKKGEIVLFSPASASFDLFKNFAERGKKFKELVNRI